MAESVRATCRVPRMVRMRSMLRLRFHNALEEDFSLFHDHLCSRDRIPRHTVKILEEHSDEVWIACRVRKRRSHRIAAVPWLKPEPPRKLHLQWLQCANSRAWIGLHRCTRMHAYVLCIGTARQTFVPSACVVLYLASPHCFALLRTLAGLVRPVLT